MSNDPITDEIRRIRHELAAKCDNDLSKIFAEARKNQALSGRTYITLPSRPPRQDAAKQDAQPESPKN